MTPKEREELWVECDSVALAIELTRPDVFDQRVVRLLRRAAKAIRGRSASPGYVAPTADNLRKRSVR